MDTTNTPWDERPTLPPEAQADAGAAALADLTHPDTVRRWEAIRILGMTRDARGVLPLMQMLADRVPIVAECAAWALGQIGDERAIVPLLQVLRSEEGSISHTPFQALWHLIADRAIGILLAGLHAPQGWLREQAAEYLCDFGDDRAAAPLIAALHDMDVGVRIAAARALGEIGDRRALPALQHSHEHDTGISGLGYTVREATRQAIQNIDACEMGTRKRRQDRPRDAPWFPLFAPW